MTLNEAIRRLKLYIKYRKPDPDDNFYEAIQLLIEAGKRIKLWRQDNVYPDYTLLPGETEE
jgi:hypothetical protein